MVATALPRTPKIPGPVSSTVKYTVGCVSMAVRLDDVVPICRRNWSCSHVYHSGWTRGVPSGSVTPRRMRRGVARKRSTAARVAGSLPVTGTMFTDVDLQPGDCHLRQYPKTQRVDPRHEALLLSLNESVRRVHHWDKEPDDKVQTRWSMRILNSHGDSGSTGFKPQGFPIVTFLQLGQLVLPGFSCCTACDHQSTLCCFFVNTDEHTVGMPLCVMNLQRHLLSRCCMCHVKLHHL